jgi:predicted unusual protein kinase regulating ubiquinone biosynthesis (AarF/ABC1/UbiB family)
MQQIFENGFFHADPHPGNLFVDPSTSETGWLLTFVDFGMVGHVIPSARAGLRELAIGLATQDTQRMLNSYKKLNILLPHANLDLIAQADAKVFERFWGKSMDELKDISFEEMHEFAKEFRELVYEMPFQVPHDLVFLFKMAATVSGLCTGLAPDFNFWLVLAPYAQKLMTEDGGFNFETILSEVGTYAQTLLSLPRQAENVLGKMARGDLSIKLPAIERHLHRNQVVLRRGVSAVLFFALLTNAVTLYLSQESLLAALLGLGAAATLFGALINRPRRF